MKFKEFDFYELGNFAAFGERANDWHITNVQCTAVLPNGAEVHYESDEAEDIVEDTEVVAVKITCVVDGYDGEIPTLTCTTRNDLMLGLDPLNSCCRDIEYRVEEGLEESWDMTEDIEEIIDQMILELEPYGEVSGKTKKKKSVVKKTVKKVVKKKVAKKKNTKKKAITK